MITCVCSVVFANFSFSLLYLSSKLSYFSAISSSAFSLSSNSSLAAESKASNSVFLSFRFLFSSFKAVIIAFRLSMYILSFDLVSLVLIVDICGSFLGCPSLLLVEVFWMFSTLLSFSVTCTLMPGPFWTIYLIQIVKDEVFS